MKIFSWKKTKYKGYGALVQFVYNSESHRTEAVLIEMVTLENMPVAHQSKLVTVAASKLTYEGER